jgi:hypothetical protein
MLLIEMAFPERDCGRYVDIILGILWAASSKRFMINLGYRSKTTTPELALDFARRSKMLANEITVIAVI